MADLPNFVFFLALLWKISASAGLTCCPFWAICFFQSECALPGEAKSALSRNPGFMITTCKKGSGHKKRLQTTSCHWLPVLNTPMQENFEKMFCDGGH